MLHSHLSCTSVPLLQQAEQGGGFWLCWRVFAETMVREEQWPCISLQKEELLDRGTSLGMHGVPPEMHSKLSEDRLNSPFHRCLSHRQQILSM